MSKQNNAGGWTEGQKAIVYQQCGDCGSVWYFWRSFCPNCGVVEPKSIKASGTGQVYARSLVHRAPTEELRSRAPYLIVMVDADEGFRLMAHGDASLSIGDRVQARFIDFGGQVIPYFEKAPGSD